MSSAGSGGSSDFKNRRQGKSAKGYDGYYNYGYYYLKREERHVAEQGRQEQRRSTARGYGRARAGLPPQAHQPNTTLVLTFV